MGIIDRADVEKWEDAGGLYELQEINDEIIGAIPLSRLDEFQPYEYSPWNEVAHISRDDVRAALERGDLLDEPYSVTNDSVAWDLRKHAARIAFFVANPSEDPIEIEFTQPGEAWMELSDGWHRLAAAQYLGSKEINIKLHGFVDHSVAGLGAICRSFQAVNDDPTPTSFI